MKKIVTRLMLCLALVVVGFTESGCSRKLDPAGAYQGDKTLYNADKVISESYDVMSSFLKYEYSNRAALQATPEIGKAADNIRDNAQRWIKSAVALRDSYATNPTSENRSKLDQAVSVLRQAITEASRYLAKAK